MNTKQEAFLAMNRHLIPDPDVDLGDGTILCRDLGTDINGEHFGPYTLDQFCHLRGYKGLTSKEPTECEMHHHIFDNARVGDKVRFMITAQSLEFNPIDGDWWTVVFVQAEQPCWDKQDGQMKLLLENKFGSWETVWRDYCSETAQLMTADF